MSVVLRNFLIKNHLKCIKNIALYSLNTSKLSDIQCFYSYSVINDNFQQNSILGANSIRRSELFFSRGKYTKKGKSEDDSDSDSEDFSAFPIGKDQNYIKVNVNSLRTDLILKSGLGMARNKVESVFYESKIRVNGEKIFKKSQKLNVGDEVDIIKGVSGTNPNHLVVSRVEIMAIAPKDESISVVLRRNKSLIIDNYSKENEFKMEE